MTSGQFEPKLLQVLGVLLGGKHELVAEDRNGYPQVANGIGAGVNFEQLWRESR